MKLSYAVSMQKSGFDSIAQGDIENNASLLAELGYEGIEISIRNPDIVEASALEKMLAKYGLGLSAIGTGQMFVDDKLSLSSEDINSREGCISRLKKHIDIAKVFGSYVIIGLARGIASAGEETQARKNLTESFKPVCEYAAKANVSIAIEPINREETNLLNKAQEVLDFIKGFGQAPLKILLDTYHMNIEEASLAGAIKMSKGKIAHVHLADSNRLCPGRGNIDFGRAIKELKDARYDGYLSAEIIPSPDFETCAKEYINNIRRLV